ncbi:MAG: endopeptidase La [Bacteroidales bacterium]|nr:endopeptidase La [Bacteroidales bacterium]
MKEDKKSGRIGIVMSSSLDNMSHMIQIPDADENTNIDWAEKIGDKIYILPLRNNTIFPQIILPVQSSRKKSVEILKKAYHSEMFLAAVAQKSPDIDNPGFNDISHLGTIVKVAKIFELPDGSISALLHGQNRVKLISDASDDFNLAATFSPLNTIFPDKKDEEFEAIITSIRDLASDFVQQCNDLNDEIEFAIKNIESKGFLINFVASNIPFPIDDKIKLLAINDLKKRGMELISLLSFELQKFKLRDDIQDKVKRELDKQQRDYFLNQQIKTIQSELGENPIDEELKDIEERAKSKQWPQHAADAFKKEFSRLKTIPTQSPDYSIQLNYLQTLVDLPWNYCSDDDFEIKDAKKILDADHYGLEKVKERIVEYLAVLKLKGNLKSPILCLFGPPGVGKTSLGRSIAKALNRKYVRVSLGGLHDEAEIRGHRKTYIGAMPGRILQNIKKAGTSNPVFVLDEIDKVASDFRGDPASALLEVLDPEQNFEFHDNFLDLDYDLSKVMFIATANSLSSISPALLDRMEIINVSGYVTEEKVEIAKKHLIPKILDDHGVTKDNFKISTPVLTELINSYTRESGVRELSNVIASLVRKTAVKIASGENVPSLTKKEVEKQLGLPKNIHEEYHTNNIPGVVVGLAWTSAGGEILYVESSLSRGNGNLSLTGNLGNVMKESAEIAMTYVKSNASQLGINIKMFKAFNVHLHVPEGAVPKDGPSAGITMFTCFASLLTQRAVKPYIAMTGELTLSGRVLPVGGIKEKILAAKRAGIKTIFMSEDNRRDIEDINDLYIKGLEFVYVKTAMELIPLVLESEQVKNPITLPKSDKKDEDQD